MLEVKRRLYIFMILFIGVTLLGTLGFMLLENFSFLDALYYNIVTVSTVGYGDLHPTQPLTRLLAVFIIVLGGGSFIGFIANATELLLMHRDTENRLKKQNIVLGIFFSEMGNHLLGLLAKTKIPDAFITEIRHIDLSCSESRLTEIIKKADHNSFAAADSLPDLDELNIHLRENRSLILDLLENPALLEHEEFTELLLSVAHLNEELQSRPDLHHLTKADSSHLQGDISRVFSLLLKEWLRYLKHLKKHYPYLFSLAVRKNPFNPKACVSLSDDQI